MVFSILFLISLFFNIVLLILYLKAVRKITVIKNNSKNNYDNYRKMLYIREKMKEAIKEKNAISEIFYNFFIKLSEKNHLKEITDLYTETIKNNFVKYSNIAFYEKKENEFICISKNISKEDYDHLEKFIKENRKNISSSDFEVFPYDKTKNNMFIAGKNIQKKYFVFIIFGENKKSDKSNLAIINRLTKIMEYFLKRI
ncbi:MAG TPA: hypothetical protein PLS66_11665 [Tepiditoga sp.]|nr:hypothetical protein [Tepiditoga sp.]